MFAEILIGLILGIVFGIFTGLTPGIHINLVSIGVVSLFSLFAGINPAVVSVFIISMAVTHTFIDIIPAVFLGAPDSDVALGVLPGHKLMLKGQAYQAVKLTVIGSLFSLILCIMMFPLFLKIIPFAYNHLQAYIGWILMFTVGFMILREKNMRNRVLSLGLFGMSGVLGLIVFKMPRLEHGLFAMLSGLFGVSMLIISINQKIRIPEQDTKQRIELRKRSIIKSIIAAVFSGSLVSFFPGLGPAQGAVIGSELLRKVEGYSFLILLGGINTVNMVVSFATLYSIAKARNGAVLAVSELINIDFTMFLLFLAVALVAGCAAAITALILSKCFSRIISRINYVMLCYAIIIFIGLIAFLLSGFVGLIILIVSAFVGLVPNLTGIKRSHAMGCLLLPVILWFIL